MRREERESAGLCFFYPAKQPLSRLLLPLLMGNKLLAWLILSKMSVYWSYLMSCQTWKQNIAFLLTPLLKHITCPVRSLTLTAPLIHSILSFRHRIPLFPRVNYPAPCLEKCKNHSIPFRSIAHAYLRVATVTRESRQAAKGLLDHSSKLGAKTQGDILFKQKSHSLITRIQAAFRPPYPREWLIRLILILEFKLLLRSQPIGSFEA